MCFHLLACCYYNAESGTDNLVRARSFVWTKPHPGLWLNIATLASATVVIVMAIEGWLMAPIPPTLVAGIMALAIVFLWAADLVKVAVGYMTKMPVRAI